MKKMIILLIAIGLIMTACNLIEGRKPEKPNNNYGNLEGPNISQIEGGESGEDISDEDDIEPDINDIDIEEDKKMTEEAMENGAEKQDITMKSRGDSAKFENIGLDDLFQDMEVLETYKTEVPENIRMNLLYTRYSIPFDYFLVTKEGTKLYKEPDSNSEILGNAQMYVKVQLVNKVKSQSAATDDTEEWYGLTWLEAGNPVLGFVKKDSGEPRRFKFDTMIEVIDRIEGELKETKYGYISNYKDRNGSPPLIDGKAIDRYGVQAYQSAPAYSNLNNIDDFRYFPDGMLVFILEEENNYFRVKNLQYEGTYWIPKTFISFEDNLDSLNKVVVVDTTFQNQAAFEINGKDLSLVSYTLATTGVKEQYKYETPKGYFKVMDKKERFYYLDDETKELAGYGPYGTRFSAGAYIHGVPVAFEKRDQENYDPGLEEYLYTIGTTPRSHKCVRNYTSHAKFIYDWADLNDTIIIVID